LLATTLLARCREFLYFEPVASPLKFLGSFSNGLVTFTLDNQGHLLSLERFFIGLGYTIRLFEVSLEEPMTFKTLTTSARLTSALSNRFRKKLLLDFQTLNLPLDNIEGLTFGPQLADGRRSLIVVVTTISSLLLQILTLYQQSEEGSVINCKLYFTF